MIFTRSFFGSLGAIISCVVGRPGGFAILNDQFWGFFYVYWSEKTAKVGRKKSENRKKLFFLLHFFSCLKHFFSPSGPKLFLASRVELFFPPIFKKKKRKIIKNVFFLSFVFFFKILNYGIFWRPWRIFLWVPKTRKNGLNMKIHETKKKVFRFLSFSNIFSCASLHKMHNVLIYTYLAYISRI